jgi:hypothetical protein
VALEKRVDSGVPDIKSVTHAAHAFDVEIASIAVCISKTLIINTAIRLTVDLVIEGRVGLQIVIQHVEGRTNRGVCVEHFCLHEDVGGALESRCIVRVIVDFDES